jgi:hypothetical protein
MLASKIGKKIGNCRLSSPHHLRPFECISNLVYYQFLTAFNYLPFCIDHLAYTGVKGQAILTNVFIGLRYIQCITKEKSSIFSYSNGQKWSLFRNDKS